VTDVKREDFEVGKTSQEAQELRAEIIFIADRLKGFQIPGSWF